MQTTYFNVVSRMLGSLVLILALTLVGCHARPATYRGAEASADNPADWVAEDYWRRTGLDILAGDRPVTIAVLEFNVEYVKHKMTSLLGDKQAKLDAREFSIIGGGLTIVGIGRHEIRLDTGLKQQLPTELYGLLVKALADQGHRVVPVEAVSAAGGMSQLAGAAPGEGNMLMLLNIAGSDTGRVKQVEVYPAAGLKAIKGVTDKGESVEEVERQLLAELGADAGLRVQFRVGVYDAYASVESGSVIQLVLPASSDEPSGSTFESIRSVVSATPVVDQTEFKLLEGDVHTIDHDRYLAAIEQIVPPYVDLALVAMGRVVDEAAATPVHRRSPGPHR